MNNQTIDITSLPVTDRLTLARRLDANNGHVTYMGRTVTVGNAQKAKDGPRSSGQLINALTNARLSKAAKAEEPASARHGAQMVYDDEGKIAGFFPGYSDDQI